MDKINSLLHIVIPIGVLIYIFFKTGMPYNRFKRIKSKFLLDTIYVLLYRGFIRGCVLHSGNLFVEIEGLEKEIIFTKYKERGKVGFYLAIPLCNNVKEHEKKIIDYVKEKGYDYYIEHPDKKHYKVDYIMINCNQEPELGRDIFIKIITEILEKEFKTYTFYFDKVDMGTDVYEGFDDNELPDFKELGIYINFPVTRGAVWSTKIGRFFRKLNDFTN
jgi:hypothetical protein